MKFQVVVISGGSGVGKNTFINLCKQYVDYSLDISTIDFVKQIAVRCGWKDNKSLENKKFLADLKKVLIDFDDLPFKKVVREVNEYHLDLFQSSMDDDIDMVDKKSLVFIHCHEPEEIKKLMNHFNAVTLLMTRKDIVQDALDAALNGFTYQFIIGNDGSVEDLDKLAKTFIDKIFSEIQNLDNE